MVMLCFLSGSWVFMSPGALESLSHNSVLQSAGYRISGESFPQSILLLLLLVQTKHAGHIQGISWWSGCSQRRGQAWL